MRRHLALLAICVAAAIAGVLASVSGASAATRQQAYVANFGQNTVSVVSLATNAVARTITVGAESELSVAIDAQRHTVYVANNDGYVYEISAKTDVVSRSFKLLAPAGWVQGIAVSRNGNKLFAAHAAVNGVSLEAINLATGKVRGVNAGPNAWAIGVDPHSQNLFVVNRYGSGADTNYGPIYRVNAKSLKSTAVLTAPYEYDPLGIAMNPVTDQGYIVGDGGDMLTFDTANDTWVSSSPYVGVDPWGITVSTDGTRVYAGNRIPGYVDVIDPVNDAVLGQVTAGGYDANGMAFATSTRSAYVTEWGLNDVAVISEATNTVTQRISVGSNPLAIGIL
jgi:YVTN family beta-propeller protein